jgi:hypothetical protein
MSSRIGTHDGLSPFDPGIVNASCDFMKGTALSDSFIDRGARTPAKAAQCEMLRTKCVMHRASTRTAGPASHAPVVSEPSIAIDVGAVEPCSIEVFAGLHVESDGDGVLLALRVG